MDFFGIVIKEYTLSEEIMQEIGIEVFDYEKYDINGYCFDEYQPDYFYMDEYSPQFIKLLRRGVIGVHQIGYIYS